jgi:hypothetical protein
MGSSSASSSRLTGYGPSRSRHRSKVVVVGEVVVDGGDRPSDR